MKAPNTGDFRAHFCCLGTFVTKLPPSNLAITQERSSIYALREDYTLLIKGTRKAQSSSNGNIALLPLNMTMNKPVELYRLTFLVMSAYTS